MVKVVIEAVTHPSNHPHWHALVQFGLLLLVALGSKAIALERAARLVEERLTAIRRRIGELLRDASLVELERYDKGRFIYPLVEANIISNAVLKAFNGLQALIAMVVTLIYISWLSPLTGMLLLMMSLLLLFGYRLTRRKMSRTMHQIADQERQFLDALQQMLDGIKEVKADPALSDALVREAMLPPLHQIRELRSQLGYNEVTMTNLLAQSFFILLGCVVFAISYTLDAATTAILVAAILFLWKPIWTLIDALPFTLKGMSAWQRLLALAQSLPVVEAVASDEDDPPPLKRRFNTLRLDQVCYHYYDRDGQFNHRVGPLSLTLRRGEQIFIIGHNGSGKSTLIKLLTGLYRAHEGRILIDGTAVEMSHYRHLFSVIFHDVHLFDRPYGIADLAAREEQIKDGLQQFGLAHKVEWLGDRFSTLDLSPGERKRLALITLLLEDKPLLIFDEWVAEQDPHYRQHFYDTLLPTLQQQGKTVIVVTHDARYFDRADRVFLMQDGELQEITATVSGGRAP